MKMKPIIFGDQQVLLFERIRRYDIVAYGHITGGGLLGFQKSMPRPESFFFLRPEDPDAEHLASLARCLLNATIIHATMTMD